MKNKANIEAIYPLTFMQQGLLLHHLSVNEDQGFLNTECTLTGRFDLTIFEESCRLITERHEVIRSTIHWKNLEKQVRVIHKVKHIDISFLDWQHKSSEEQITDFEKLKRNYLENKAKLESGALLEITIVKIKDDYHKLLWPMHHILLDGWSGSILLKDISNTYNDLFLNKIPHFDALPNYKSYLNWTNNIPEEKAKTFWSTYLNAFKNQKLFGKTALNNLSDNSYLSQSFILSETETISLKAYCKKHKITLNTFIQGIWSLVISRYFNTNDVVHGVTVSGRTIDFPNIDVMAGMFMNLQPVRSNIDEDLDFSVWFQNMQKFLFEARNYEHISLDKIYSFFNWSEHKTLFDSLVVFENYPTIATTDHSLEVSDIKSGLTSTYPITLAIIPNGNIKFVLTHDTKFINNDAASWIITTLKKTIQLIVDEKTINYQSFRENIASYTMSSTHKGEEIEVIDLSTYQPPKNKTELELLKIWESCLNLDRISTRDNFFEIGGKSLTAIKMFAIINKKLKIKLSVTKLLEHPSIAELSDFILSDSEPQTLQNIVPIRTKGHKTPLFCIHAGGGHVLFYGQLKNYLYSERPIYAIQPSGINETEDLHESIETMAKDYLSIIKKIQPKGPYNILVHCFSTTVGNEMSLILDQSGEKVNLIVVDSMATSWGGVGTATLNTRIDFFFERLFNSPVKTITNFIIERYRKIKPSLDKHFGKNHEKQLGKVQTNLQKISAMYEFKPHNGKVSLILAKKEDIRFENFHIESWEKYAKGGVKVYHTSGHHYTLFEKPDVQDLSKQIDLTIND